MHNSDTVLDESICVVCWGSWGLPVITLQAIRDTSTLLRIKGWTSHDVWSCSIPSNPRWKAPDITFKYSITIVWLIAPGSGTLCNEQLQTIFTKLNGSFKCRLHRGWGLWFCGTGSNDIQLYLMHRLVLYICPRVRIPGHYCSLPHGHKSRCTFLKVSSLGAHFWHEQMVSTLHLYRTSGVKAEKLCINLYITITPHMVRYSHQFTEFLLVVTNACT